MPDIEWKSSTELVPYEAATAFMEERVRAIREDEAAECVWLLEHPPLYTAGTSADASDLLSPDRFPVYQTGRGGQYTYHGPGQRVAYVMLDLTKRGNDVRRFVHDLEQWIIDAIGGLGVTGERRAGRVGIWVKRGGDGPLAPEEAREDKIGAIGVRVRRWVTYHGIAINVSPDLDHFSGIIPCGINQHGVTSIQDLGINATMADLDAALCKFFPSIFDNPLEYEAEATKQTTSDDIAINNQP